jgi:hypothetical protein
MAACERGSERHRRKFGGLAIYIQIVFIFITLGLHWLQFLGASSNRFSRNVFLLSDLRMLRSNGSLATDPQNVSDLKSLRMTTGSDQIDSINMSALALADRLFDVPDNIWPPTRALMVNSTIQLRWKLLNKKKIYITYGENCCRNSLSRACHAALTQAAMDECRALTLSALDSDFRERNRKILAEPKGAGLWLWKPYIINRTLHEMADGEYLVYADAGSYFNGPIYPLLVLLEKLDASYGGVLVFGVGLEQSVFCKRDAFVQQRCDTPACHKAGQVNGALSIWRRGAHALRVVDAWLRDCQDYQVRSSASSQPGDVPPLLVSSTRNRSRTRAARHAESWAWSADHGPQLISDGGQRHWAVENGLLGAARASRSDTRTHSDETDKASTDSLRRTQQPWAGATRVQKAQARSGDVAAEEGRRVCVCVWGSSRKLVGSAR